MTLLSAPPIKIVIDQKLRFNKLVGASTRTDFYLKKANVKATSWCCFRVFFKYFCQYNGRIA